MYYERLTNVTWAKPDPPPNALHTAFTHEKAVGATPLPSPREPRAAIHAHWRWLRRRISASLGRFPLVWGSLVPEILAFCRKLDASLAEG